MNVIHITPTTRNAEIIAAIAENLFAGEAFVLGKYQLTLRGHLWMVDDLVTNFKNIDGISQGDGFATEQEALYVAKIIYRAWVADEWAQYEESAPPMRGARVRRAKPLHDASTIVRTLVNGLNRSRIVGLTQLDFSMSSGHSFTEANGDAYDVYFIDGKTSEYSRRNPHTYISEQLWNKAAQITLNWLEVQYGESQAFPVWGDAMKVGPVVVKWKVRNRDHGEITLFFPVEDRTAKTRTALPLRGKRPSRMGETAIKMANDLLRALQANRKFRGVARQKNWMGSNKYSDTQVVTIKGDVSKWGAELQDLISVVENLGYQVTWTSQDSFRAERGDPMHRVRGSFFPSYARETTTFTLEVYAPKKAAPSTLPYYD